MARHGEKEDAVYEAVFRLMARGEQMHTVTVQQIAREAGIGKGTVYEYFTSREEILIKAFLRRAEQELQILAVRVEQAQSFDGKLESVLDTAQEMMRAQSSCIKLLLTNAQLAGTMKKLCGSLRESGVQAAKQLCALASKMLADGVREGALPAPPGEAYGLMTLMGGVFGYVNTCRLLPEQSEEALRTDAKRMIYRALGKELGPTRV